MTVRFLAVGDLMIDVVVAGRGHDAVARLGPGGTAANVAVWAASLGAHATAVGAVGDDTGGRFLRMELERRGVEALLAVDAGERTGTFLLADGELRVDRGANARLEPSALPPLPETDAALVSGYLPGRALAATLADARADWVMLDAATLDELPAGGNAVVANEQRARALTGKDAEDAARALSDRYRLACVTCGARGAVAVLDGRLERAEPPRRALQEVPGAGDAFSAGLLVALARGVQLEEALAEGCRCGAAAAASPGWPTDA
ncbi:MAG TPA: PfkB family carbohydrate kinase [Gaiellaceae bacterium]|nr:PfkB family carbohydrate kinase [Gaiellaceae bacterium]